MPNPIRTKSPDGVLKQVGLERVPCPDLQPGFSQANFERFFSKVDVGLCWEWTAYCSAAGYGRITMNGRYALYSHRVAWEMLVGPIPEGLTLDHLCKNRRCCNPDHLEPCTLGVNTARSAIHERHRLYWARWRRERAA